MTEPKITIAEHVFAYLQDMAELMEARAIRDFERRTRRAMRFEDAAIRMRKRWAAR
jgi:hypothetical protein